MKYVTTIGMLVSLVCLVALAHGDPAGGEKQFSGWLGAHSYDTWNVCLRGGEATAFRVRGTPGVDIDCYLYDSDGDLVAKDNDESNSCMIDVNVRNFECATLKVTNVTHEGSWYSGRAF